MGFGCQWRDRKLLDFIKKNKKNICVPKMNKSLAGLEHEGE